MAYVNCARYAQEQNLIAVQVCKTQCDWMHFCNTAMHWLSYACFCSISLGDECDDNVCLSADAELKNIIAPIKLMFLRKKYYTRGLVFLQDYPDRDPDLKTRVAGGTLKLDIN